MSAVSNICFAVTILQVLPTAKDAEASPATPRRAAVQRSMRKVGSLLNRPTCASLLGVLVGATPLLRDLLVSGGAPLRFVVDAMELLANGVPLGVPYCAPLGVPYYL